MSSSSLSLVNRFDEPGWGTFDNNDDVDSVWGFNAKVSRQPLTFTPVLVLLDVACLVISRMCKC